MIETLALALSGLGIAASIFYYANIINNANKARERELINQRITMIDDEFYDKWRRLMLGEWTNYGEWLECRLENPKDSSILSYFCTLFNSIGLLFKRGMIDSEILFSVYAPQVILFTWQKTIPVIEGNRKAFNYPGLYNGFEFLYSEAKKMYPDIKSFEKFIQYRDGLYQDQIFNP